MLTRYGIERKLIHVLRYILYYHPENDEDAEILRLAYKSFTGYYLIE